MNTQTEIEVYLKSIWPKSEPQLQLKNIPKLFANFSTEVDTKKVYLAIDSDGSGKITLPKVASYLYHLQFRTEIQKLYQLFQSDSKEFDVVKFNTFLEKIQKNKLEVVPIFNSYADFEFWLNGTHFELGLRESLSESSPLSHYYISSSHNTYLEKHQLIGKSSSEAYQYVLENGCKCVEIDTWDDSKNNLPVVSHGYTLTTSVPFSDVLKTIKTHAFSRSDLPVIITLENHCSSKIEAKMASYLNDILGDCLWLPVNRSEKMLPKLEQLKNKIILRGKVLQKTHPELAKLIYIRNNKVVRVNDNSLMSVSYDEDVITTINQKQKDILKEYSKTNLIRVYPHGSRFDSSNYNPIKSWSDGCQLVALNWQYGKSKEVDNNSSTGKVKSSYRKVNMRLNQSFFRLNGGVGYRLKPAYLLNDETEPTVMKTLRMTVWSGRFLWGKNLQLKIGIIGYSQDTGYQKSKIVSNNGLTPEWNEKFTFKLLRPHRDFMMVELLDSKKVVGYYCVKIDDVGVGYRNIPLSFIKLRPLKGNLFVKVDLE